MKNIYNFNKDERINTILNECWSKCYNDIKGYNIRKIDGDLFPVDFLDLIKQVTEIENSVNEHETDIYAQQIAWEYCNEALVKIIEYFCNKDNYKYKNEPNGRIHMMLNGYCKDSHNIPEFGIIILLGKSLYDIRLTNLNL